MANVLGIDVSNLLLRLHKAWSKDTSNSKDWSGDNPAWGQCAVTALVVQDLFGGDLVRTVVNGDSHYLNKIGDEYIDLTRSQFRGEWEYGELEERTREYVLSYPDTAERYKKLKNNLEVIQAVR